MVVYLRPSEYIDWQPSLILQQTRELAEATEDQTSLAKIGFEWYGITLGTRAIFEITKSLDGTSGCRNENRHEEIRDYFFDIAQAQETTHES